MNDFEANFQHLLDFRRGSLDPFPLEPPQKLTASQFKLHQLVKKTHINSSPKQIAHHPSKRTPDATLWETLSPGASRANESSHFFNTKPKNTTSPKLNSTVSSKLSSKAGVEGHKGKMSNGKSRNKASGLVSNVSFTNSPKIGNLELSATDINYAKSIKENGFNPQSFMKFLLANPKTAQYQNRKAIKLNSCVQDLQDEEEDEKNLSLEARTKSFTASHYQQQQKKGSNSKNVSQDSQTILASSKYDTNKQQVLNNEKNKQDLIEKLLSKKKSIATPDNLTSRDNEQSPVQSLENKVLRLTPKLKRQSSSKGSRYKSGSKGVSPNKNVPERGATHGRRENIPGNLYLRAVKGSSPNILSSTISRTGCSSSTKNPKKGDSHSQTFMHGMTGDFEKSNEITLNGTQDTTKVESRKELNGEENDRKTVKMKRLMRAKSHGGSAQIEEAIAEILKQVKSGKSAGKTKPKFLSVKSNLKYKKTVGGFKSMDCHQDGVKNIGKENGVSKKGEKMEKVEIVEKVEKVEVKEKEKSVESNKMEMLNQLLVRTSKMLGVYKDRERTWQAEKKELLEQISVLKEKENN